MFSLLIVRFFALAPPLPRFHFLRTSPAGADAVVVVGLDLVLWREVVEVQAALLEQRPALVVQARPAALPQPVEEVLIAAWPVHLPHRHALDQGIGEALDAAQRASLPELGQVAPLVLVGRSPSAARRLDE